jgi:hypothetical protein
MRIPALFAVVSLGLATAAVARVVQEVEPNDTLQTAQSIDAGFNWDIGLDPDIEDSETIPHVTIMGSGNNGQDGSFDYYKFTVSAIGVRGIFDIDYGRKPGDADIDTELFLYSAGGAALAEGDDSFTTQGGSGSSDVGDSYFDFVFPAAGVYVIGVARWNSFDSGIVGQGIQGPAPIEGQTYRLQVSIVDHEMSDLPPLLPGDANRDGKVDLSDFGILKSNFGKNGAIWDEGDFDGDAKVALGDFGVLKDNFGKTSGGSGAFVVPEPSTWILASLGWLYLIRRRMRA